MQPLCTVRQLARKDRDQPVWRSAVVVLVLPLSSLPHGASALGSSAAVGQSAGDGRRGRSDRLGGLVNQLWTCGPKHAGEADGHSCVGIDRPACDRRRGRKARPAPGSQRDVWSYNSLGHGTRTRPIMAVLTQAWTLSASRSKALRGRRQTAAWPPWP